MLGLKLTHGSKKGYWHHSLAKCHCLTFLLLYAAGIAYGFNWSSLVDMSDIYILSHVSVLSAYETNPHRD